MSIHKICFDAKITNILQNLLLTSKTVSLPLLSLPLIQEGQLSVSGKRMCTILVNRSKRTKPAQ